MSDNTSSGSFSRKGIALPRLATLLQTLVSVGPQGMLSSYLLKLHPGAESGIEHLITLGLIRRKNVPLWDDRRTHQAAVLTVVQWHWYSLAPAKERDAA